MIKLVNLLLKMVNCVQKIGCSIKSEIASAPCHSNCLWQLRIAEGSTFLGWSEAIFNLEAWEGIF